MKRCMRSAIVLLAAVSVAVGLFTVQTVSAESSWKPEKPINLVVPWGAGGATDGVSRQTAKVLEGHLGQKIVIVNLHLVSLIIPDLSGSGLFQHLSSGMLE